MLVGEPRNLPSLPASFSPPARLTPTMEDFAPSRPTPRGARRASATLTRVMMMRAAAAARDRAAAAKDPTAAARVRRVRSAHQAPRVRRALRAERSVVSRITQHLWRPTCAQKRHKRVISHLRWRLARFLLEVASSVAMNPPPISS